MVLWSQPRLAIARAPSVDSGFMKRVDSSPVYRGSVYKYIIWDFGGKAMGGKSRRSHHTRSGKGKMEARRNMCFLLGNPEIGNLATQSDRAWEPHNFLVTQRREGLLIPFDKRLEMLIWGSDAKMVDVAGCHGC